MSFGTRLYEVHAACEPLSSEGITPTVADARFAKPLDKDLILDLAARHRALITIEEGSIGGFGSHVADLLARNGAFDAGLRFRAMTLPDAHVEQGSPSEMYADAGLDAAHIAQMVRALLSDR